MTVLQVINTAIFQSRGLQTLGFLNLALVYIFFAISSVTCHRIFHIVGLKWGMIMVAGGYFAFTCVFIILFFVEVVWVLWVVVFIGASCSGMGAGLFWVSQGVYMSLKIPEDSKAKYMGIFYSMNLGSGIVGGLMTAFLFIVIKPEYVIGILALFPLLGMLPLLLLAPIGYQHQEAEEDHTRLPPWRLLPIYLYTGVYIGTAYGALPFYIGRTINGDGFMQISPYTTFLCLGTSIAGSSHGWLSQKTGLSAMLVIALSYQLIALSVSSALLEYSFSYWWLAIAVLVGSSDGAQFGVVNKLTSNVDTTEYRAFQKYRFFHPTGAFLTFLLSTFVIDYVPAPAFLSVIMAIDI